MNAIVFVDAAVQNIVWIYVCPGTVPLKALQGLLHVCFHRLSEAHNVDGPCTVGTN